MNSTKHLSVIITILLLSIPAFSQSTLIKENENLSMDSGTIDSQFEYIFKKSGDFKGSNGQAYEAVKKNSLLTLKANTLDSLKKAYEKINNTLSIVNSQTKEIASLKQSLSKTQETLEKISESKDTMSFFGIKMNKINYNILIWFIIVGLFSSLIYFIYKFKNSNTITKEAKLALKELEEEFDEHRKIALEREQKVRRQLIDERNKHKGK